MAVENADRTVWNKSVYQTKRPSLIQLEKEISQSSSDEECEGDDDWVEMKNKSDKVLEEYSARDNTFFVKFFAFELFFLWFIFCKNSFCSSNFFDCDKFNKLISVTNYHCFFTSYRRICHTK